MSPLLRNILAIVRFALFMVGTLFLVVIHTLWYLLSGRLDVTMWFHKFCCVLFNIRVHKIGYSAHKKNQPVIYLSNHVSYLDILVLGSFVDGCFVAKSEVATWPGFGLLAKLQKTIFIVRDKSALMQSRAAIAEAMNKDFDIILFPEGTSTDGWDVMQFKAGLLGIFFPEDKEKAGRYQVIDNALIQPVAIKHVKIDGKDVYPDRKDMRDLYAWYGDMDLVPHLLAVAKVWRTDVEVHMLPPLNPGDFTNRFDIANVAQERVAKVIKGA